jgi:hypothetical protein
MFRVDPDDFPEPDHRQLTFFDHAAEVADTHPRSLCGFLDRQQVFTGSGVNFHDGPCYAVPSAERTEMRVDRQGSPPFGTPANHGRRDVRGDEPELSEKLAVPSARRPCRLPR